MFMKISMNIEERCFNKYCLCYLIRLKLDYNIIDAEKQIDRDFPTLMVILDPFKEMIIGYEFVRF
jgi:hypothetical protein